MTLRTLIAAPLSGFFKRALIGAAAALMLVIASGAWRVHADDTRTGVFSITYGDFGPLGTGEHQSKYRLFDNAGGETSLDLDPTLAEPFGGVLALAGQQVQVTVETPPPPPAGTAAASPSDETPLTVASIQPLALPPVGGVASAASAASVNGTVKWANILCKFKDNSNEPVNQSFFSSLFSSTAPGLNNFWSQQSYGKVNLIADTYGQGAGWYTLPRNRCDYIGSECLGWANLKMLADDCTAAADAAVNFAQYDGVNLIFNDTLDGYAWGGTQLIATNDGSFIKRMTWDPPWAYQNSAPIAHEIGHGLGLPHSNNYDRDADPYDNTWDLMSSLWFGCSSPCTPRGTISQHLDMLGWIDPGYKFTASLDRVDTIALDTLDLQSVSDGAYRMAVLPITSTRWFTIEARRKQGSYDKLLPGSGVIIHDVVPTDYEPAWVIGAWLTTQPTLTTTGAIFAPGETYEAQGTFFVHVDAATATGYVITIGPMGSPAAPVITAPVKYANQSSPIFTWAPVQKATQYRVTVKQGTLVVFDQTYTAEEAACADVCTVSGGSAPAGPTLLDGKYKVTVTGLNAYAVGKPSKARTFTVDTVAPNAPIPLKPLDGEKVRAQPTLKAGKVKTGYRYHVAVSLNADCSDPFLVSGELKSPSFKMTTLDLGTYTWCAEARDAAGNWSGYGPASAFTLAPVIPSAPGLIAPASKAKVTSGEAFFTWKTVNGGDTYELAFASDSKFLTPIAGGSVASDAGRAPSVPLGVGPVYWRVRAINVDGEPGSWSGARLVIIVEPAAAVLEIPLAAILPGVSG